MKQLLSIPLVMDEIAALLKLAGFEFRNSSMKSESCYYGLPGRDELIRLSSHRKRKPTRGHPNMANVATTITLTPRHCDPHDTILMDPDKVDVLAAAAIGRYMITCGRNDAKQQAA